MNFIKMLKPVSMPKANVGLGVQDIDITLNELFPKEIENEMFKKFNLFFFVLITHQSLLKSRWRL